MAKQTPISNSRRPTRRVPALHASRTTQPTVSLGLQQLDRFHDRAERALSETIAAYGKLDREVDAAQWKCVRTKHRLRLFRARQSRTTIRTPLLCIGVLRGRFDDVMEGLYCQNTEDMQLMNAIKCPRLSDSSVLYTVQRQSTVEPYAFTGIKWATIKMSVSSDRDLCYFDKMGMVHQASGKRMAYHVMQSVNLPECPSKLTHKRVQLSVCYLLEELGDDAVGVYMRGSVANAGLSYFASLAIADVLLSVANATECARAKKLTEMQSAKPSAASRRSSSSQGCCDVCKGTLSFFELPSRCAGCGLRHVCRRCRVKERVLAREATPGFHLKRVDFCRVCVSKAESMSMDELCAELTRTGSVDSYGTEGISESSEVATTASTGFDKSLTSFSLKVLTQVQQLDPHADARVSNLSSIGNAPISISDDEDEVALLESESEECDFVRSRLKESSCGHSEDFLDRPRGSHSTSSTTSSSCYDSDDEDRGYHTSLLTRLRRVSYQAEETLYLARRQSQLAHSMLENTRRRAHSSGADYFQSLYA